MGFETETEYLFFKASKPYPDWVLSKSIVPIVDDFISQIAVMDKQASGEDRMFHMEQYLTGGYVYLRENRVEGFYLPAFGDGLIIAANSSAGFELMKFRLAAKEDAAFPAGNTSATKFMHQHNFKEYKTAKRMRLGAKRTWSPENIYNRIGGNLG